MNDLINQVWSNINSYLIAITSFVVLGLLYVLNQFLSHKVKSIYVNLGEKLFSRKNKTISKEAASVYTKILNELISLRAKTDASRVYIHQFHNGESFANLNSRWKLSRTYETCADGIKYEGRNLQNIDVTLLWSIVQIFYTHEEDIMSPGIKVFNQKNKSKDCDYNRQIYFIDVKKLSGNKGFTKSIFASQGIDYCMICPILNLNNEPTGYIGIDYCGEGTDEISINDKEFEWDLLCRTSIDIGFQWIQNPKLRENSIAINKKRIYNHED